jgi:hypothetical protein
MRTEILMKEHTLCQHSTPFAMNGPTKLFQCFAIHLWRFDSPFLYGFHHKLSFLPPETAAISFLAANVSSFLVNVCASAAMTVLWFQNSQMKLRFHHLLRCDWETHRHLCCIALKQSKLKPFSAFCVHPWALSEAILRRTGDSPA